ncbi:MAG: prepilin-type N-terminal cleavage/methylation domain-containing protein [Planctomycetes bacterium]|nr:prepilin-type N-terminal cleavage/methylation domain-containing protein [Planctomycetota bacterium]
MSVARRNRAFSLVELIVVVVIIGILAAIAIPRFSRGASGAGGSGIKANLSVLRNAIELYYYEHGDYPGKNTDGTNAAGSEGAFIAQLIKYSDEDGDVSDTKDSTHRYGPYLRKGIPACPVSPRLGKTGVHMLDTGVPAYTAGAADAGWVFNYNTGDLCVNSNDTDPDTVAYDTY